MTDDLNEKTLSSEKIYDGRVVKLRKDAVLLPDGKKSEREVISHSGGAGIVAESGGKMLLVRQFRYAYGEVITEIPAGKIDKGEKPEDTAKRELEEETGIRAKEVELLFVIYPTPGYTDEKIYIYLARGLSEGEIRLDDNEFLNSFWIDVSKAYEMVEKGEIKDSKTIIALQYLKIKNIK